MTSAHRQSILEVVDATMRDACEGSILSADGTAQIMQVIDAIAAVETDEQNRVNYQREYEAALIQPAIGTIT